MVFSPIFRDTDSKEPLKEIPEKKDSKDEEKPQKERVASPGFNIGDFLSFSVKRNHTKEKVQKSVIVQEIPEQKGKKVVKEEKKEEKKITSSKR